MSTTRNKYNVVKPDKTVKAEMIEKLEIHLKKIDELRIDKRKD